MKASVATSAPSVAPDDLSALPQLIGVQALSRRLGVGGATVRAWARRGEIPSFKIGRLTMFDSSDVALWLASKRIS